jgi:hypothetical protein
MQISVVPPKEVILQPAVPAETAIVNTVDIQAMTDNCESVVAAIIVDGVTMLLSLWDSTTTPTYDEIGNWTQEQANARIIELI